MSSRAAPQWLIIVCRDKRDICVRLQQGFKGAELLQVIVDRRQGERRRGNGGAAGERRRTDRRRPTGVRGPIEQGGYRLIQQGDGFEVYQATGRVPATCPSCLVELEFELPRFGEPPARLDIAVIHLSQGSFGAQHFVEAQAFKASGRSLLACRILAKRQTGAGLPAHPPLLTAVR